MNVMDESVLYTGDFGRLQDVVTELNADDPFYGVRVWPEMSDIDVAIACFEADNIIETRLEKYRAGWQNPSFHQNLTEYCQNRYRAKIADWLVQNGSRDSQGGSSSIHDGEAS